MLAFLARNWWALALRGALAVLFGVMAWIWPDLTVRVLVLLFGAYALVDGVFALYAAFTGAADRRWALLFEAVVGIGAGIVTFVWPDLTALTLLYIIASWAVITGLFEIVAAVQLRREIEGEVFLALGGLLSILFGVLLFVFPGEGAVALAWLIGAYAVVFGVALIALGLRLRGLADRLPPGTATRA
jgi:uncharacterized membrane protein HdeD (DUF308 family)